mmetsp:Transcript_6789/g.16552  ORF Transcript_6789/g.16552 Transcript_6789/m.16552 type:complete len:356 (-) Transcript_6789:126-1193(-)
MELKPHRQHQWQIPGHVHNGRLDFRIGQADPTKLFSGLTWLLSLGGGIRNELFGNLEAGLGSGLLVRTGNRGQSLFEFGIRESRVFESSGWVFGRSHGGNTRCATTLRRNGPVLCSGRGGPSLSRRLFDGLVGIVSQFGGEIGLALFGGLCSLSGGLRLGIYRMFLQLLLFEQCAFGHVLDGFCLALVFLFACIGGSNHGPPTGFGIRGSARCGSGGSGIESPGFQMKWPLLALGHFQKHAIGHFVLSVRTGKTQDVSSLQARQIGLRSLNNHVDNRTGRIVGPLFHSDSQRTVIGKNDFKDLAGFATSQRVAGSFHFGLADFFNVFANVGQWIVVVVVVVVRGGFLLVIVENIV